MPPLPELPARFRGNECRIFAAQIIEVKLRKVVLFIALIILVDQALKIWIKTTYPIGHVKDVMGFKWFQLYFIENEGMAWGWKFGGEWGKMILTLFRLAAVVFGSWYLVKIVKSNAHRGF